MLVREGARALYVLDAVLLEKKLDALCKAADRLVLGLHELLEVQFDVTHLNAAALCVMENLVVQVRVVEERLARDAADIEASAAECPALLDTGDLGGGGGL